MNNIPVSKGEAELTSKIIEHKHLIVNKIIIPINSRKRIPIKKIFCFTILNDS